MSGFSFLEQSETRGIWLMPVTPALPRQGARKMALRPKVAKWCLDLERKKGMKGERREGMRRGKERNQSVL